MRLNWHRVCLTAAGSHSVAAQCYRPGRPALCVDAALHGSRTSFPLADDSIIGPVSLFVQ